MREFSTYWGDPEHDEPNGDGFRCLAAAIEKLTGASQSYGTPSSAWRLKAGPRGT
jgi:hypothetical protein